MGCEATMNFSLLEVQRRVSCAEGGRLHEPVRKGARCWGGSGCILTTGIWALNFCFSLSPEVDGAIAYSTMSLCADGRYNPSLYYALAIILESTN